MLDHTDVQILEELSKNSRITMKELGEKVHLTGQATASRITKLEDNGVIEGYSIKVNQGKLGCFMHAFINIYIKDTHHQPYLSFIKTQERHVINNYKISGDGCYLLECRFPSNESLDQFLLGLNKHANYKLSIVIKK
ncbi:MULTISPECIES: Lrp/AsnC family transcriptional regulator [Bacillus]|uniref:Lrp/AsnC family transcriptional regulator n=1 Tax=Bacillus pretiosus TaxID=2983392 RepID=A0ABT3ESX4_9BACI|nr:MULTISPECIES: Lrp/AsnC family transcriptional regulator [Bacillus]MCW1239474.1 Lrp/AsnC family transcriptional regulator [Bacillus pretiosus]MED2036827.1 Lrp/AsnC family transcriptional regulator [Bacillus wiedmannii]TKI10264.1 Lrp/AsnC family transcriptional regulator [Bacillus wiedmannii]